MSQFDNNYFLSSDGSPVTSRPPTEFLVFAPEGWVASDTQRGEIAQLYKMFCTAVRLSPAKVHTQYRDLSDGGKVKFESKFGADRITYWPLGVTEEGEYPTFFCIPFDETLLNPAFFTANEVNPTATYGIMRWPNLKSGDPTRVLDGLKEFKKYVMYPSSLDEMKRKLTHPGNQTWFARETDPEKPRHRHADFVLSWWGQNKRYAETPMDLDALEDHAWGRSMRTDNQDWFFGVETDPELAGLLVTPPVVAKSYGEEGHIQEVENPAPSIDEAYYFTHLWINGLRVETPFRVFSACIGRRNDKSVVRIAFSDSQFYPENVAEISLRKFIASAIKNSALTDLEAWEIYPLPHMPSALQFEIANRQLQPPYWNADGSEGVGLLAVYPEEGHRAPYADTAGILYKILETLDGFSVAIVATSEYAKTYTQTRDYTADTNEPVDGTSKYYVNGSTTSSFSGVCGATKILAADYRGNELRVLSTEYYETASCTGSKTKHDYFGIVEAIGPPADFMTDALVPYTGPFWTYWTADGRSNNNVSGAPELDFSAWGLNSTKNFSDTRTLSRTMVLKLNDVDVATRSQTFSLSYTQAESMVTDTTEHVFTTQWIDYPYYFPITGCGVYQTTDNFSATRNDSRSINTTVSCTGSCTEFGIVGGDLRGDHVLLYESPMTSHLGSGLTQGIYGVPCPNIEKQAASGTYTFSQSLSLSIDRERSTGYSFQDVYGLDMQGPGITVYGYNNANHTVDVSRELLQTATTSGSYSATAMDNLGDVLLLNLNESTTAVIGTGIEKDASIIKSYGSFTLLPTNWTQTGSEHLTDVAYSDRAHLGLDYVANGTTNWWYEATPGSVTVSSPVAASYTTAVTISSPWNTSTPADESMSNTTGLTWGAYDHSNGSCGYVRYSGGYTTAFTASALSPDGVIQYIGYSSPNFVTPGAADGFFTIRYDKWFVNGGEVTPTKSYPYTGEYKMLSSPVFVGPLPPKRNFK